MERKGEEPPEIVIHAKNAKVKIVYRRDRPA